jgi:hypothetical protein
VRRRGLLHWSDLVSVLRALCSLNRADGCRALRCEALSVSVQSLGVLVAELLIKLVGFVTDDVGAQ